MTFYRYKLDLLLARNLEPWIPPSTSPSRRFRPKVVLKKVEWNTKMISLCRLGIVPLKILVHLAKHVVQIGELDVLRAEKIVVERVVLGGSLFPLGNGRIQ